MALRVIQLDLDSIDNRIGGEDIIVEIDEGNQGHAVEGKACIPSPLFFTNIGRCLGRWGC